MTDKPTPTELKAMWQLHAADIGGIFHYARAVLEKWGTPATGGEPAGTVGYTVHGTQYVNWRTKPPAHGTPLYTAPQPTQAQAAEPVAWLDPWTGAKVTTDYDAYGKHGIPLYTAPQPVARGDALDAACQRACMELPVGMSMAIQLELHAGWIELHDSDGEQIELPNADGSLAEQVHQALDAARAAQEGKDRDK